MPDSPQHQSRRRPRSPDSDLSDREAVRHERSRRDEPRRHDSRERHRRPRDTSRERTGERDQDHRQHRRDSRDRERSSSPPRYRRHRSRQRSPSPKRSRRSISPDPRRSNRPLPSQNDSFHHQQALTRGDAGSSTTPLPAKQKPNYKPTGLLAKEANTIAGTSTVLKYHEPPESRKPSPKHPWRLYVFKHKDLQDTIHLYQRSVWLMGRDAKITDVHLEHPSISKQHAVIQFRYMMTTNEFGEKSGRVKPYLLDLDSANGTHLNDEKIAPSRYVELMDGDVIFFGDSDREYVVMLPAS